MTPGELRLGLLGALMGVVAAIGSGCETSEDCGPIAVPELEIEHRITRSAGHSTALIGGTIVFSGEVGDEVDTVRQARLSYTANSGVVTTVVFSEDGAPMEPMATGGTGGTVGTGGTGGSETSPGGAGGAR